MTGWINQLRFAASRPGPLRAERERDLALFGLDPNKENEKITPDTANAGSSFSIQKPLDHFSRRKVD